MPEPSNGRYCMSEPHKFENITLTFTDQNGRPLDPRR